MNLADNKVLTLNSHSELRSGTSSPGPVSGRQGLDYKYTQLSKDPGHNTGVLLTASSERVSRGEDPDVKARQETQMTGFDLIARV